MKSFILLCIMGLSILSCNQRTKSTNEDWCNQKVRVEFQELDEISINSPWFKVHMVGENVYAISEPYNYEEVISYLILGNEQALLFDTGNGFDSISNVVKELTNLPVTVVNSHAHYDHIGGNYEFSNILALQSDYTLKWAESGWGHDLVKDEVTPNAICLENLPDIDTAKHHVRPFRISKFITDGQILDLGDRNIKVISVPGHSPDGIALMDEDSGYLWTGDVFYEGTIWLYFDGTNLESYEESINKLALLAPSLKKLFPAHNIPISEPKRLIELSNAFNQIVKGGKKAKGLNTKNEVSDGSKTTKYEFDNFSFLIRNDHLKEKGIIN